MCLRKSTVAREAPSEPSRDVEARSEHSPRLASASPIPWIAVTAVVVVVGKLVDVPGVDSAPVALEMGDFLSILGLSSPLFSVIGIGAWALLALRLGLAFLDRSRSAKARRGAFAAYLALVALQSLLVATWAESMNDVTMTGLVVSEPGWSFRFTAVLACTSGASVLWWLADRIDATDRATGALVVALWIWLVDVVLAAGALGVEAASADEGVLTPSISLLMPVAMLITAMLLAWRKPSWPLRVGRNLELRSAWDVLALPGVAALLVTATFHPSLIRAMGGSLDALATTTERLDSGGSTREIASLMALVVAMALILLWRVRVRAGLRSFLPLLAALGASALIVLAQGVGFVAAGGVARAQRLPLEGNESYVVTLEAVGARFHPNDGEAMVRRAERLGVTAEIVSQNGRRITLRLSNAASSDQVLDALRPHRLALQTIESPEQELEPPLGVVREHDDEGRATYIGDCPAMHAWVDGGPLVGCEASVLEFAGDDDESLECELACLVGDPVITERDLASVAVGYAPEDEEPLVRFELRPEPAARFADFTEANHGARLAIIIDGAIWAAPVIRGRIETHGQIALGGRGRPHSELLADARTLAAALDPEAHIRTDWTLVSIDEE